MFRKLRLIFLLLFAAVYSGYAQAPVAAISATPTTSICPGQAISFADASTGSPTSWLWTFPSGSPSSSTASSVAVVFPTSGSYTVTLKATNASGSSTATIQVNVNSTPVADFTQDKTSGCFPTFVQFTNTSTPGAGATITSYSWSFGDGTQDTAASPNHHYTVGGTLPVTLYVKNNFGCVGTAQIKNVQGAINLSGQVIANFSYSLNTSCTLPVTATFTNTSTGPAILSYLWDFGDGSPTDNTFAPTHPYSAAGNDTARLTVTSTQGCSDIMKVPVTISSSGNITDFTMPDTVCVNTVVNFTNTSSPYPNTSDWLYGDGSPADLNKHNGQHTYTVPGTYNVKLTNAFSLCGGNNTKKIVVVGPPVTSFTGANLISCKAPLTSTFTDASVGATSWVWDFGDGSPTVNGQGPQPHTYTKIGDFTVTLNTSAVAGCSSSKTMMVHVDTPIVKIVGMPAYGCAPYTFTPTASVTTIDGVASYSWIMGNGNTSSSPTPPAQIYPVGTFTMYCTITTNGGCVAKDSGTIKVGSIKPVPSFTWTPSTICVKTFVNFSGLAPGADQWKWDFGDGSTNTTSPSPIYKYTKPGTFTVKFTAYNSGCWDTISHTVVVDAPAANFSYSSILCSKNNYLFTDKSIGPPTGWIWDFGDGSAISNATNPTHPYAAGAPTTYTVKLIASTATCKDTISLPVKVNQTTTLAFTPSNSICVNTPVTVTATAFGNIGKYIFDYGDGSKRDTATVNNATHTYLVPNAAYQVKVITIDPTSGCVDSSAAYTMTVNGPTAFYSGPPLLSCGAITVNFTDLSTDVGSSIVKWAWDFGDGGTSTVKNPNYLYANQGNFVARLTVTDGNGCSSTYDTAKPLTVSIMVPKYTLSDTLTCPNAPKQTKFINSSIGGFNPVYSWNFGDGSPLDNTVSPSHVYTSVNRFYDTLTMKDTYGCVAKYGGPSIRVDTPYAAFSMSGNFSSCPVFNDTFHFTGHYALSYSWVFDDGGISVQPTPVNGYALPGMYHPYLDIISPGGCVSHSATQLVTVLGPTGTLTYSPTAACDSLTVNMTVAPTNAISFLWIPGDGSASVKNTSPTFQFTYKTPGQWTPIVYLTDNAGCTRSEVGQIPINIDKISSVSFTADKYIVCDTGIVNFTNTSVLGNSTVITDFRWDFGDGATTNGPGDSLIAHKYTSLGNDSVALTLTSFAGCKATHKVALQVVPSPNISFTGLVNQCAPGVMNYAGVENVPDPNGPVSWSWVFGNGQTANGQAQPGIAYPKAGEYVVYVTAKNAMGCSTMTDTAGPATHLFIYPIPSVNAGIDATICDTSSLQLNATGTATSYTWDPPVSGNLSTLIGPSPVATSPISTFFVVHGASLNGCTAKDTINVTVNTPLTITATGTDSVCIGQSVTLNASGAAQYVWTPSAGLNNPNIANPVATPDTSQIGAGSSAIITYSVTGTDNKKCYTDTKTVDVTAFKNPVIGLIPNATINVGSSYQINSTASTNIVSLNWTPTNNLSCTNCLTPVASPTITTKYSLTATNDGGCATTESIRVQVICTGANFFVPNSFSPNGDGVNDYFIVNGVGLNVIPSITIYNRWGQMVFQKSNFAPNSASQAWDGTFNGKPAPPDVYIYTIQILCENATLIPYHGNVTLIR